ncbi:DUF3991 domain-containing protein [Listeria innocua]|uniref:DUF3991 domain-containing protein n=1 Tax=Listeria innocua TaxID=1642 RepID=UPI0016288E34|nr:DUF3991 domain-containing protein [Listeria innocua]MBC1925556.1 DUF3991 domain-containing protein [Listeria innocua]
MKFYTETQVEQARNTNILEYMIAHGEDFIKEGRYFRHSEHSSWVFDDRNKMIYFNKSIQYDGKDVRQTSNCLTIAMMLYDLPFQEAVGDVLGTDASEVSPQFFAQQENASVFNYHKEVHEAQNFAKGLAYLTKERELDPKLVTDLYMKGLIRQDVRQNIVFKMLERSEVSQQGKLRCNGVELRGTTKIPKQKRLIKDRPYFMKLHENNELNASFHVRMTHRKPTTELKIFEAPIEVLSYISLYKATIFSDDYAKENNVEFLSMHGLKYNPVHAFYEKVVANNKVLTENSLEFYPQMTLCVNNDEAGREFAQSFRKNLLHLGYSEHFIQAKVRDELPKIEEEKGKDFNDLLKLTHQEEAKQKKRSESKENVQQTTSSTIVTQQMTS